MLHLLSNAIMIQIDLWSCIFVHTVKHAKIQKDTVGPCNPWGIVSRTPKSADAQRPFIKWHSTISSPYPGLWKVCIQRANCILEKEMVTNSSILARIIPWTEEPGGLQSTGSQRIGHDWLSMHACMIYNIVLVAGIHQSDTCVFSTLLSLIGFYKILSLVRYTVGPFSLSILCIAMCIPFICCWLFELSCNSWLKKYD